MRQMPHDSYGSAMWYLVELTWCLVEVYIAIGIGNCLILMLVY